MDIYSLLHKDHAKVKSIFQKLEETTARGVKARELLFLTLKAELTAHAEAEEKFLYPELVDPKASRPITLEAIEEHRVVKMLLAELESDPKDTEQWAAKLKVLQENVEHHVKEEENELFPKAKKILTADKSADIARSVQDFKDTRTEEKAMV